LTRTSFSTGIDTYRAIFARACDALLLADDEGRLIDANPAAEHLTGYPRDELLGLCAFNLTTAGAPEDPRSAWRTFLAGAGGSSGFELRRKDGARRLLRHRAVVDLTPGVHLSVLQETAGEDAPFGAVQASEARLEALLREAETRAALQSAVSRILAEFPDLEQAAPRFVRAVCETLGWEYGAIWLDESRVGLLRCASMWAAPGPGLDPFLRQAGRTFRTGEGLPGQVVESGRTEWVEEVATLDGFLRADHAAAAGLRTAVCVPVAAGPLVLGAVEFFCREPHPPDVRLIDTLRSIGRQLGQYIERGAAERSERAAAAAASRLKDEFLAVLSHELRTPLNAVLGWTRLLRAGHLDAAGRVRALDVIERNVQAQSQIIEDLLDVSRIITGKLRLDVQRVDMARVASEVVESMRPAAEAKGIALRATLPEGVTVCADPSRLQQIAWNLLSNAIKFTSRGGDVEVVVQAGADSAALTVRDTGSGIASEVLPRVFERFLQADSTTTRQHGGLGLGLAIVRHLVELHGGAVSAHSGGEGAGATFRVELPLAAEAVPARPADGAPDRA
jgi:PAS domain S-box-containing protein